MISSVSRRLKPSDFSSLHYRASWTAPVLNSVLAVPTNLAAKHHQHVSAQHGVYKDENLTTAVNRPGKTLFLGWNLQSLETLLSLD